jgi:hypothetical protein
MTDERRTLVSSYAALRRAVGPPLPGDGEASLRRA